MKLEATLVSILFFLSLSAASTNVEVSPKSATASPSEPAYFSMSIQTDNTANFSITGSGPGDVDIAPKKGPVYDNKSINVWYRPEKELDSGGYRIILNVTAGNTTEQIMPTVTVENNHRLRMKKVKSPTCKDRETVVSLQNKGIFSETVDFYVGEKNYLSTTLGHGEKRNISFNAPSSPNYLEVISKESYASDHVSMNLQCGPLEGGMTNTFRVSVLVAAMATAIIYLFA